MASSKQIDWAGNKKLAQALGSELYQALAMQPLHKKHDVFLRGLRARRLDGAAFVDKLSNAATSSASREHTLLLKAFKLHGDTLDPSEYETKLQVVIASRLVDKSDEGNDKIVFNRGNLHPHSDRFVSMAEEFKTQPRVLQQTRQWKLSHTYRASDLPNRSGFSNSNPPTWSATRSLKRTTFWSS